MGSQAERNAAANAMQAKVKQKIISQVAIVTEANCECIKYQLPLRRNNLNIVCCQVVKRNLVENIIPIIIALKSMLSELKSPLVHNVMLYLKVRGS